MKKIILVFILSFALFTCKAQGIKFTEGNFNKAIEQAKRENKPVFVEVYASWCGYCKYMESDVFTTKMAGDFYNKNFINIQLDGQKGEGIEFTKTYPIKAYPTYFYFNVNRDLIHKAVDAKEAEDFVNDGKTALELKAKGNK